MGPSSQIKRKWDTFRSDGLNMKKKKIFFGDLLKSSSQNEKPKHREQFHVSNEIPSQPLYQFPYW